MKKCLTVGIILLLVGIFIIPVIAQDIDTDDFLLPCVVTGIIQVPMNKRIIPTAKNFLNKDCVCM
jgi:hypothetical protein